jgi:hypothetical protein
MKKQRATIKAIIWLSTVGLLFAALMLFMPGCATVPPGPGPAADCDGLCAHGVELGCRWAQATPKGASCVEMCLSAQTGPLPWNFTCSAKAESCAAVDACNR